MVLGALSLFGRLYRQYSICCCSTYSVGVDLSRFHLGQEVSGGELELILQVNLQQSIVVTNIILCTWRGRIKITSQNNFYNTIAMIYKTKMEPVYAL